MSVSDKEISSVEDSGVGVSGSGGAGDDHDDVDDDDEKKKSGGVHKKHRDDDDHMTKGRGSFGGFSRNLGKAKSIALKQFNKKLCRKSSKSHVKASSSSPLSASGVSRSSGKRIIDFGGGKGCFFCFTPNASGESAIGSQTSDPNDPAFTYDMLRVLMETSDFYSKECNTHLDSDVYCSKD